MAPAHNFGQCPSMPSADKVLARSICPVGLSSLDKCPKTPSAQGPLRILGIRMGKCSPSCSCICSRVGPITFGQHKWPLGEVLLPAPDSWKIFSLTLEWRQPAKTEMRCVLDQDEPRWDKLTQDKSPKLQPMANTNAGHIYSVLGKHSRRKCVLGKNIHRLESGKVNNKIKKNPDKITIVLTELKVWEHFFLIP